MALSCPYNVPLKWWNRTLYQTELCNRTLYFNRTLRQPASASARGDFFSLWLFLLGHLPPKLCSSEFLTFFCLVYFGIRELK